MGKKEQVRSYYDQYSSNYDSFYMSIQKEKFNHMSQHLQVYPILLDLGGGTGFLSSWVDSPLINLDISYDMLRNGLSKRKFLSIAADLEHLPFRSHAFQNVISLTAFQNTSDLSTAFLELKRIMENSSQAVVTLLNKLVPMSDIEQIFQDIAIPFTFIPFSGEDICYVLNF